MQLNRWRYYASHLGRWLTRDMVGSDGTYWGLLYVYALDDPITFVDPSGDIAETIVDIGGIGYDTYQCCTDPSWSNFGYLGWSVGAAFIPCVPGSWAGRGAKAVAGAGDDIVDAAKAGRKGWKKGKPGRKKQGREPGEKKRDKDNWKPRNPPKEPPPHTPSRKT